MTSLPDNSKSKAGSKNLLVETLRRVSRYRPQASHESSLKSNHSVLPCEAELNKSPGTISPASSVTFVDVSRPPTNPGPKTPSPVSESTTSTLVSPRNIATNHIATVIIEQQTSKHDGPSARTVLAKKVGFSDGRKPCREPTWSQLRASLQKFEKPSGPFPDHPSPIRLLLSILDRLEVVTEDRCDYKSLVKGLSALGESLNGLVGHRASLLSILGSGAVLALIKAIDYEVCKVEAESRCELAGNLRQAKLDERGNIPHYQRVVSLLQGLEINANMSKHNIPDPLERFVIEPVTLAAYNSTPPKGIDRRSCTIGTRMSILDNLVEWFKDPVSPTVYWIDGVAGTGKTTIAYTFCQWTEEWNLLGASFFCTRRSEECRSVGRIIPTIAHQLSKYSIPFRSALCDANRRNPKANWWNLENQLEEMLIRPLRQVRAAVPDRLAVVIDGLDECDELSEVESILNLLWSTPDIPLRFLITSRPESRIHSSMLLHTHLHGAAHLHDFERSLVQADIKLYLTQELQFISPTEAEIYQLVERCGVSFVYGADLVRYARNHYDGATADPRQTMAALINITPESISAHVYEPYLEILRAALTDVPTKLGQDIVMVLSSVVSAQEPINIETIGMLSGIGDLQRVKDALNPLRSTLRQSAKTGLLSTIDPVPLDLISREAGSARYSFDASERRLLLAQRCFYYMREQLQFNICNLASSRFPDDEQLGNIQSQPHDKIGPTLAYVCRAWSGHLSSVTDTNSILPMLSHFLSTRLLFWMEVLNLQREISIGVEALMVAKQQLKGTASPPEIIALLNDAYLFVRDFAASPVSRSTPHIYISSLQLCSSSSMVYRLYSENTREQLKRLTNSTPGPGNTAFNPQPWKAMSESGVTSIAYSPNGDQVAVGCEDGSVRVYNPRNGSPVGDPLIGHTDWVRCVVFSPDSAYILSASSDCTIRMWNSRTGRPIRASFTGHSHPVKSIAFSPDGNQVVSGSWDNTVRIWNAKDGIPLMKPLEGHKWGINCVAYSPNGTLVASGANDQTVRLWDLTGHSLVSRVLKGHTGAVMSIAFTPDGAELVSGSVDGTICVWSVNNRALARRFLQSCTHIIYSVAVSPDGSLIASGSADSSVRAWHIYSGELIVGPFVGHSSSVRAVTFSPNGTQLLTGSRDGEIRSWDLRNPAPLGLSGQNPPFGRELVREIYSGIKNQSGGSPSNGSENGTNYLSAGAASLSWLLDSSRLAYIRDDLTKPIDVSSSLALGYLNTHLPRGWTWNPDGWIVDSKSRLLFWLPPSAGSCHLDGHTANNLRLLSLWLQGEHRMENRWPGSSGLSGKAGTKTGRRRRRKQNKQT